MNHSPFDIVHDNSSSDESSSDADPDSNSESLSHPDKVVPPETDAEESFASPPPPCYSDITIESEIDSFRGNYSVTMHMIIEIIFASINYSCNFSLLK